MMTGPQSYGIRMLLVVFAVLPLVGCQEELTTEKTVTTQLVDPEPVMTGEGVRLETTATKALAYVEVIEQSPNVKSVTRMTDNEDEGIVVGPPALSPTEDVLVYAEVLMPANAPKPAEGAPYVGLTASSNLFRQVVGSPAKTRITRGTRADLYPAFSTDGKHIIFSSNRTGPKPMLWRISVAGAGGITKLSSTMTEDYAASVTPRNEAIVYNSNLPGADQPQIWTMKYDGLLPTQLREGWLPQISPDGQKILFLRRDKESFREQLWMMRLDGSEETQLTNNTDYDIADAKWGPDGASIVYASDEGLDSNKRNNFDIWMMDSSGINKTQLTTNGSHDDAPCWDRQGRYIYFRSNRGGTWNIWRFEPVVGTGPTAESVAAEEPAP